MALSVSDFFGRLTAIWKQSVIWNPLWDQWERYIYQCSTITLPETNIAMEKTQF